MLHCYGNLRAIGGAETAGSENDGPKMEPISWIHTPLTSWAEYEPQLCSVTMSVNAACHLPYWHWKVTPCVPMTTLLTASGWHEIIWWLWVLSDTLHVYSCLCLYHYQVCYPESHLTNFQWTINNSLPRTAVYLFSWKTSALAVR